MERMATGYGSPTAPSSGSSSGGGGSEEGDGHRLARARALRALGGMSSGSGSGSGRGMLDVKKAIRLNPAEVSDSHTHPCIHSGTFITHFHVSTQQATTKNTQYKHAYVCTIGTWHNNALSCVV